MPETTTAVDALREELATHQARFSPIYQGYLSDHGPMAALALLGLGAAPERVRRWLDCYRERLEPLSSAPVGYRRLLEEMQDDVSRIGPRALLARELPELVSGWVRNAFHPLIRTAYGHDFGLPEEVAAGLAYLKWCGPDLQIARAAAAPRSTADPDAPFTAMKACTTRREPDRRFDDAVARVTEQEAFRNVPVRLDEPLARYSQRALAVFATTHDFFALHLVTGAHAFRVLHEFAGPHRDAIFAFGLLAGYAGTGAPDYAALPSAATPRSPGPDRTRLTDEHDIKLAYSAACQAEGFQDLRYQRVADDYLDGR